MKESIKATDATTTPTHWLDYLAIPLSIVGIIIFSVWTSIRYLIAVCTGRGEAWR